MIGWLDRDYRLFTLARRGKRLTPPLLLIVLVFVIYDGGLLVALGELMVLRQLPPFESLFASEPPSLLGRILRQTIAYSPIYLLLWIWLRWFEKRRFSTLGLEWDGALKKHLRGILVGLLMTGGWFGLQAATGHLAFEGVLNFGPGGVVVFCGTIVTYYLTRAFQVGIEEILFRGWMLPTVGVRYGTVAGVLVSAAFFSLFHFWHPLTLLGIGNLHDPWPPLNAFTLFLYGVFLALWTLRDGSVWGPVAFHATTLWSYGFVFGAYESVSLLDVQLLNPDPRWLTGIGGRGVMDGLPGTAVLLVGVMVMVLLFRRETTNRWTNENEETV